MLNRFAALAALLWPLAAVNYAQITETYHTFDIDVPTAHGVNVTLHSRLRTQPRGIGFYEARFGPIVNWRMNSRSTLSGGYYFAEQNNESGYRIVQRPFAGASTTILSTARTDLSARMVVERTLTPTAADYNRYRGRLRLGGTRRLAPYTSFELFLDRHGWRSHRLAGGMRAAVGAHWRVDGGYFFESRRTDAGGDRHVWTTGVVYEWERRREHAP
jgi:hypothetical protein